MKWCLFSLIGAALCAGSALYGAVPETDVGWPRTYSNGASRLVIYQPQVDNWPDYRKISGRCAFAISRLNEPEQVYGTFRFEGDTLVDAEAKIVLLRGVRVSAMRFPAVSGPKAQAWQEIAESLLPTEAMVISLDRLLAFLHAGDQAAPADRLLNDPPPVYVSTVPAVLVITDGEPVLLDVKATSLRRVINTNWDLYLDRRTNRYYLYAAKRWLSAPDLKGEFVPAADVPADLARQTVAEQDLGPIPKVLVSERPSELIAIHGDSQWQAVPGTSIQFATNTKSDLFYDTGARAYYFLTAGRWFRAPDLQGPWAYSTGQLPEGFRRIPPEHPRAHVLASVPGTREAEDAVLLAGIPRMAEIRRSEAKAEAQYVGTPEFVPISGTEVAYARNSPNDVLRVNGRYYLCLQGVWFVSPQPAGPWVAAAEVPAAIYTIPPASPKYHVTQVRIYSAGNEWIVTGYTSGYYGAYVAGGVVVWGTGYYYPPFVAVGVAAVPVYWGTPCYTYGAGVWYNPAAGMYARGAAVYGPYGGYGAAAAYNPRTGVYSQGAAVWGPGGGAAAIRTYNPSTGRYSAGVEAANPYARWGQGVVSDGSSWARGGYQSTNRGTVAAGETSKGGRGVAIESANGQHGYVGKSGQGDLYAGANGNVYKRTDGQWYRNQDGSWNAVDKNEAQLQQRQAEARERGERNAQRSEAWRANGRTGFPREGGEARPRIQGRRR